MPASIAANPVVAEMSDGDENPFRLPPDDEIFLMRERERNQRAEDREKVKRLKVHEKTTASSRIHRIRRLQDDDAPAPVSEPQTARGRMQRSEPLSARDPRREKENITDFVEKKKEMFLVQMSLDVKKAEILKLDEKAKMKDDALKKSQAMLDEDVTRFDTFLQANDAKAHKAMKQAEDMTKKKQEKMQKIKQLKSQISVIQSEISKHKEQKEECIKFKTFLEKLTPIEWKEKQAQLKLERKKKRKQGWIQKKMEDIEHKMQQEIEAEERAQQEKEETQKTRRKKREEEEYQREKVEQAQKRRHRIRGKYKNAIDTIEKDYQDVSSGEEMPLYFTKSHQLLDIFTALEESNLFLIQNSQETEQALEEVEQKFEETKRVMGSKAGKMKQQIAQLEKQIADEKAKCEELKHTVSQKRGASEQDQLLKELDSSVLEVHTACGFDADHDPNTLQMLAAIEAKLEELLTQLDEAELANPQQLDALERSKEKERRERVRHQRKELQDRKIEERLKASLLRSQAPVHKKIGKQIMFRSAPLFQARKVVKEDDGFEDAEKDHNVFGIWISKEGIPNASQPVRPS